MPVSESNEYRYKLPRRFYMSISKKYNEQAFEGDNLKPVREAIDKVIQATRKFFKKGKTSELRSEVDKAQRELETEFDAKKAMLTDRQQIIVGHYKKLQEGNPKSNAKPSMVSHQVFKPKTESAKAPVRPYLTSVYN